MCEFIGECDYEDIQDGGCSHYDGDTCRNGERLNDEAEYRQSLIDEEEYYLAKYGDKK